MRVNERKRKKLRVKGENLFYNDKICKKIPDHYIYKCRLNDIFLSRKYFILTIGPSPKGGPEMKVIYYFFHNKKSNNFEGSFSFSLKDLYEQIINSESKKSKSEESEFPQKKRKLDPETYAKWSAIATRRCPCTVSEDGKQIFFLLSNSSKIVFYITMDGDDHRSLRDACSQFEQDEKGQWLIGYKDGQYKWKEACKIELSPEDEYTGIEFFEEFNTVGLLREDDSVKLVPLTDPPQIEQNILDAYFKRKGVCKKLTSSLPSEDIDKSSRETILPE